ncbi:hypothetical protein D7X33_21605 [Butyricicoccus sp. 1XD8-22]|nr:hypothetical protein D7X33_21605 [Butyricicoccus sp. 1XD8-22]
MRGLAYRYGNVTHGALWEMGRAPFPAASRSGFLVRAASGRISQKTVEISTFNAGKMKRTQFLVIFVERITGNMSEICCFNWKDMVNCRSRRKRQIS